VWGAPQKSYVYGLPLVIVDITKGLITAASESGVLERAGMVIRGQRAQYRPCALDAAPIQEVSRWAEQYRSVWEERFDRMEAFLEQFGQSE
jgi:hypothetical protein